MNQGTLFCAVAFSALTTLSASAQDTSVPAPLRKGIPERRVAAARAQERLEEAWREFGERNTRGDFTPSEWSKRLQPKILSLGELDTLFTDVAVPFTEPDVIRSHDGTLRATLVVAMAHGKIGDDPVYLRSYNGKLVGPTLRCKPGDTLFITVENKLPPEVDQQDAMNTLHRFNTTNLHTHGLHVSPSGVSDNVLLSIAPGSTQEYAIEIGKDHPCGTFWYHAHLHGSTAAQVGSGMAGALIVEGGMDQVPEVAQAQERILVLQQIPYVNNGSKAACTSIPANEDLSVGVIEPEYKDCSFGPGDWDRLGRFTTINGVKLPVIKIRPGAIERWRIVNSALRERVIPELVRHERSEPTAPSHIAFEEIAVDGLPLGRRTSSERLELWPGYRSDVLVQAPNIEGARYMLRDAREVANGASIPEERRYLAMVLVEGETASMAMPTDAQLAGFRLPSIRPEEVTGREVAAYGLVPKPNGAPKFTIDRQEYSPDESRILFRDEVHEWTLTSRNPGFGAVSHPFHIHVNPFEIFSILNEKGVEQLPRDPVTHQPLPLWRDTIILNEGWKVSCRTRYQRFDGTFVAHCHILDHEDQGMMELIEIRPPLLPPGAPVADAVIERPASFGAYAAPDWELAGGDGAKHRLSTMIGGPTILVFFEGFGCLRCNAQIQSLGQRYAALQKEGLQVIGISTGTNAELAEALAETPIPFPIVADPELKAFRAYGCYAGNPLHGAFLLDGDAMVRWQLISKMPYGDLDRLIREAEQLKSTRQ